MARLEIRICSKDCHDAILEIKTISSGLIWPRGQVFRRAVSDLFETGRATDFLTDSAPGAPNLVCIASAELLDLMRKFKPVKIL